MKLGQDERKRLLDLPKTLQQRVVGQDEAVRAVADSVVRSRAGTGNPKQPSGSFLFLGPTGVGKTELAKALTEQLFDNHNMLIRIDMSEYVGSSSVARFIGAAPGLVGHEDGGQLTELVRQRPYSVVLFDEVEKADDAVVNLFLRILDEGRLTDGRGRTVDFTNTIIIMTSNLGAPHLLHVVDGEEAMEAAKRRVLDDVKNHFRPELINRLDEMVVFGPLSEETLRQVARMQLQAIADRLAGKGVGLHVSDAALDVLLAKAADQVHMYGARTIRWCLQKHVMTRVSQMMVEDVDCGFDVCVDVADEKDELVFTVTKKPPPVPDPAPSRSLESELLLHAAKESSNKIQAPSSSPLLLECRQHQDDKMMKGKVKDTSPSMPEEKKKVKEEKKDVPTVVKDNLFSLSKPERNESKISSSSSSAPALIFVSAAWACYGAMFLYIALTM